jgi:hypothetical protein
VNGESYGIYVSVEQINKDLIKNWFGGSKGARWKVPPTFAGSAGLAYLGEDLSEYQRRYELKYADDEPAAWTALKELSQIISETTPKQLPFVLPAFIDVDEWLWFLALDLVFQDDDGYHSRASDYELFLDKNGIFHPLTRDNNEAFRAAGGGPGARNAAVQSAMVAPLADAERADRPVTRALLSVPEWRARYLSFVRLLANKELRWSKLEPEISRLHSMIDSIVQADSRKLESYDAFTKSIVREGESATSGAEGRGRGRGAPALKNFIEDRRAFLLGHPELAGPWPEIAKVATHHNRSKTGSTWQVSVTMSDVVAAGSVWLYVATGSKGVSKRINLKRTSAAHVWETDVLPLRKGENLRFYVEALSDHPTQRVSLYPAEGPSEALRLRN